MTINIDSYLSKKFKGHKIQKIASLIDNLGRGKTIPKGTLVIMASGDARLRLKILDKDTPHKGFSTPLQLKPEASKKNITPNYLRWYLSQKEVAEELIKHATGSIILRVPKQIIESIPVPIPKKTEFSYEQGDIALEKESDDFKSLISIFYDDFRLNVDNQRYRTSIILAGAICEIFLFQLLIDYGVEKKLLEGDNQLSLGKMVQYVKLLKIDKDFDVPINHIQEIRKIRNQAVHIGANKSKKNYSDTDIEPFNQIIKYFGI